MSPPLRTPSGAAAGITAIFLAVFSPLRAESPEEDLCSYAMEGLLEEVERLLDQGVSPNAADGDGETALMFAAGSGFPKIVKVLLTAGADANAKNSDGQTALIGVAISDGEADIEEMHPVYAEIARILLGAGVKAKARDNDGKTALDHARAYRLEELTKILEKARD
ncbi:MAG: ankyrin repeat domain-containing protein [Acidobacteriota bacterium]